MYFLKDILNEIDLKDLKNELSSKCKYSFFVIPEKHRFVEGRFKQLKGGGCFKFLRTSSG